MSEYYDRQGKPISNEQWIADFANDQIHKVGLDEIGDTRVSTVWLGLDHSYGDGPPLIFETMCFGGKYDGECWRYSTEQEAVEGHKRAVDLAKKGLPEPTDTTISFKELTTDGLVWINMGDVDYECLWVDTDRRVLHVRPV